MTPISRVPLKETHEGVRNWWSVMNLGIDGKTALVTAASKGLGRACALALAAEGVNVVICARGSDALESTAREITSAGGTAYAVVADVTDAGAPDHLVQTTVGRFGGIDILVGNSGGPPAMRALEADDAAMAQALNDNLRAMVRLVRAAVPRMAAGRWGRICLITSSAVKEPIPALALSNTARTGLWAWSKTAAQDLWQQGVTLNLACPGYHATDRLKTIGDAPDGQFTGDPADFGKIVAFMCSEPAGFVSGAALQVDGAQSVLGLL
jgi:3-oxoacyl-[acyl-carrier protein] reductase